MRSCSKFVLSLAICVAALSLCASADSIRTFTYVTPLDGVTDTTVHGAFTFNGTTNTFTTAALWFTGHSVFAGLSGVVNQAQSGPVFNFNSVVGGYAVSYTIAMDTANPGSYTADGDISVGPTMGTFKFHKQTVPEGGTVLFYLALSGLVLFTGILLSGKQRREARICQIS